jgi:hypothetical protein
MKYILLILVFITCVSLIAGEYKSEFSDGRKFRVTDNFVFLDECGNDVSMKLFKDRYAAKIRITAAELTRLFETNTAKEFWFVSEGQLMPSKYPMHDLSIYVTGRVAKKTNINGVTTYFLQGHRENAFIAVEEDSWAGIYFPESYELGDIVTLWGAGHRDSRQMLYSSEIEFIYFIKLY